MSECSGIFLAVNRFDQQVNGYPHILRTAVCVWCCRLRAAFAHPVVSAGLVWTHTKNMSLCYYRCTVQVLES